VIRRQLVDRGCWAVRIGGADASRREFGLASLKDVSRLAGVSLSTASRVVTSNPRVDKELRKRVLAAVAQLNYKPNLLARGLRNRSGRLIGFMVPEILHETFAIFISETEAACVDRGFTMILGNTHDDPAIEERVLGNLIGMNVDGIVISVVSDSSAVLGSLKKLAIPAVGIDRALENESIDMVEVDNREAGAIAGRYLHAMGHVKIACLAGPHTVPLSRERSAGFRELLGRQGIEPIEIVGSDFEFETGAHSLRTLLERGKEFTAIWAQNDLLAIGAMREMNRLGIRVPEDVSIIGMDDIKTTQMVLPRLTTIRQPFKTICRKAVELLVKRMQSPGQAPRRIVLAPGLVIRDSVRKLQNTLAPVMGASERRRMKQVRRVV
jgi:DNA-binding LacI/PurR family transcriptional regulator